MRVIFPRQVVCPMGSMGGGTAITTPETVFGLQPRAQADGFLHFARPEQAATWISPAIARSGFEQSHRARQERIAARRHRIKRILDCSMALLGLVIYLPTIALAALLVQAVDPGRAFYAQKRRDLDGRRIRVWKLRTMYRDAEARLETHLASDPGAREEWQRYFKLRNDPRILPHIGTFLRKS